MAWYNDDWLYRVKITVPSSKVSSTLTDFPVYLDLSSLPPSFHENVKTGSVDIRITSSDGSTELARELVSYDDDSSLGELHFKAPSLSSVSDTIFFVYYGNPAASDYSAAATYGSQNVWTNGYRAVWHGATTNDSTSNGRDLTMHGGSIVDGHINKAYKLSGPNSDFLGHASSLGLTSQANFPITMSTWVKPQTASPSGNLQIITIGANASGTTHRGSRLDLAGTVGGVRPLYGENGANYRLKENFTQATPGIFNHAVGVITSAANMKAYLNGVDQGGSYLGSGGNVNYNTANTHIGRWNASYPTTTNEFAEIRVSDGARSDAWVAAEYTNQKDVHSFFEIDTQEWRYPPEPEVPVPKDLEQGELDIPEYTIELWSTTGVYMADVSILLIDGFRLGMPLNDVEDLEFSLDLVKFEEKCERLGVEPRNVLDPYRTEVKIKRNGAYLLGTQVVETLINLNNQGPNTIQIRCTGYLNLFKDRYISPGVGDAYKVNYENRTYSEIAQRLILDTQKQTNGHFGVTLGPDTASPSQSMTRTRSGDYDNQGVKDGIINLTKLDNDNFDFKFTWDKRFECFNRLGSDKPEVELVYSDNVKSMTVLRDSSTLANKITGIGSGIGDERLAYTSIDSTSSLAYGVREKIELFNSTSNQDTLDDSVAGLLPIYKDLHEVPTVHITNGAINPGEVITGDSVLVKVEGSTFVESINSLYRIIDMKLNVNKNNEESITLKLIKWE